MRKIILFVLIVIAMLSLAACNSQQPSTNIVQSTDDTIVTSESSTNLNYYSEKNATSATSIDELSDIISKDIDNSINALNTEWEKLSAEINTYEKYRKNTDKIEAFYTKIITETRNLRIKSCNYSINYAELIVSSNSHNDEKYDDLDVIYDNIYDDIGDKIYDEIYDGILDDMYDTFYSGILDDAYDSASYTEWSDTLSNEYDLWSDTLSDVYDEWSDFLSDVYDFWSDIKGDLWDNDIEKVKETINDFQKDIVNLQNDNENS